MVNHGKKRITAEQQSIITASRERMEMARTLLNGSKIVHGVAGSPDAEMVPKADLVAAQAEIKRLRDGLRKLSNFALSARFNFKE